MSTAVQEERQRVREKGDGEVESTSGANSDMPVEQILEAELAVEPKIETYIDAQVSAVLFCGVLVSLKFFSVTLLFALEREWGWRRGCSEAGIGGGGGADLEGDGLADLPVVNWRG